jgi:hypothetical protein
MLARASHAVPTLLSFGAALGATYAIAIRPRMIRWGATDDEVARTLPGDDLVPQPRYIQTHAISIAATPGAIWPWLVQMGQGRAGLYSYDRVERAFGCQIENADRIVPELQSLAVGDEIRLVPEDFAVPLRFVVGALEPERALVLRSPGTREEALEAGLPFGSWAFVLEPIDPVATRLVVRFRSDYQPTPTGLIVNGYALEPVHFLMERKMLMGIRDRAERAAADRAPDKMEAEPAVERQTVARARRPTPAAI